MTNNEWLDKPIFDEVELKGYTRKFAEISQRLQEDIDNVNKIFITIARRAKQNDPTKCMENNQPICQRCNRLSFGKGGMLPEAKLGKCKNFQNKRK